MTIDSSQSKSHELPRTIEARLLEIRRRLAGLARPADPLIGEDAAAAGPSTVIHPFYDKEARNRNQTINRSSIQSAIVDIQKGTKSFLSDASKEYSSDPASSYPSNGAEDFSIAVGGEEGGDAETLKKLNERKSLLVSLLREQSNHSLAVSRIRDDIDGIIGAKEIQSSASLEALMICALSLEDDVAKEWPTTNLETASKGLDDAVHAFQAIAKEMQLESFADQHDSSSTTTGTEQQKRAKEYTITFAARILVIDVDLTLELDDQIWLPKSKVRISYATDSSNGNDLNRFRNAKLAELLGKDVQAIASAIFGGAKGERRKDAAQHLRRLQANVGILKRLDDLSETVCVPGYPDLFALMEDVGTEKLVRLLQLSPNSNDNLICQQHETYPYATILLHGNTLSRSKADMIDFQKEIYMLRLDIGHSIITPDTQADNDEMNLPKLQSTKEGSSMKFLIRLEPALAMQLRDVRQISKIIGLQPNEGHAKSNTNLQDGPLIQKIGLFNVAQKKSSRIKIDEEEEEAVYVNCIPIASLKQLLAILPILQEQVDLNEILSSVHAESAQSDEDSTTHPVKVSVNRSELDKPVIRMRFDPENETGKTLSVNLQKQEREWVLEGGVKDGDGHEIQTLTQKDSTHIASLLKQPNGGLLGVIDGLHKWVAEGAIEGSTPAIKRLKRRSSEAGLSEDNPDSLRPTNRPRNEDV
ncbi:hypothetical protein L7F22_009324 [Adiantum nelumboides]|nr:hypothetical protein [Adiantum nelumboides]